MSPPEKKLSLVNGDRSPPAILQDGNSLSLSLKQVVLAVSPQTTPLPHPPSENNRPGCVCQLFEKLTTISNCTYYSQLLEQLGSGKTPWSANRNGSHQRAVEWLINR